MCSVLWWWWCVCNGLRCTPYTGVVSGNQTSAETPGEATHQHSGQQWTVLTRSADQGQTFRYLYLLQRALRANVFDTRKKVWGVVVWCGSSHLMLKFHIPFLVFFTSSEKWGMGGFHWRITRYIEEKQSLQSPTKPRVVQRPSLTK